MADSSSNGRLKSILTCPLGDGNHESYAEVAHFR
jgi:hypothetical protein